MPVAANDDAGGGPSVVLTLGTEREVVPLEFAPACNHLAAQYASIVESPIFVSWATSYVPRTQQSLKLRKVRINGVKYSKVTPTQIIEIHLNAEVVRIPEELRVESDIVLRGPGAGVLIVFRVNFEFGGQDGGGGGGGYEGPRFREYILFVKYPRPAVGAPESREIASGYVGPDGRFIGPCADMLEKKCNLKIYEESMEDMTSLALSAYRNPVRSQGVSRAPAFLDERVRLYLYRETVSRDFINRLMAERRERRELGLDLWALNNAWRVTTDSNSLAALLLFFELRYHDVMPRYRAPRGLEQVTTPYFTSVANLDPNSSGQNLRVLVVEPYKLVPSPVRPDQQRAELMVGDSSGIVKLSLDPSLVDVHPSLGLNGSPFFIRNSRFEIIDGHGTVVLDEFGKLAPPTAAEMGHFSFTVNKATNISAVVYERVPENTPPAGNAPNTGGGGYGPRRGGRGGGAMQQAGGYPNYPAGGRIGRGGRGFGRGNYFGRGFGGRPRGTFYGGGPGRGRGRGRGYSYYGGGGGYYGGGGPQTGGTTAAIAAGVVDVGENEALPAP